VEFVPSYVVSDDTLNCFKCRLHKQRLAKNNVHLIFYM